MSTPCRCHQAATPFGAAAAGPSAGAPAYPGGAPAPGGHRPPGLGAEAPPLPLAHESSEQSGLRRAIAEGTRDETTLTNRVFAARHPERAGRALSRSEPGFGQLAAEWTSIRDTVVRPLLAGGAPAPTTTGVWVPGAERIANPRSAGGTYVDAPWRFVFHTIEGEPSAAGFRALAASHANPPHLWAMPGADLLLQTVPLDRSAYALARPGSVQTNRARAVQVECWGFAATMGQATPETLNWLADRVLGPVARLVPIDLQQISRPSTGESCYGTGSPCRMTPAEWQAFGGVCGHYAVPDNTHWDPALLSLETIAARARATWGGTGPLQRERPLADHDGPGFAAEVDEDEAPWPPAMEWGQPESGQSGWGQSGWGQSEWGQPGWEQERPSAGHSPPWSPFVLPSDGGAPNGSRTTGQGQETATPWALEFESLTSSEVRWVQGRLNQVMGSALAVDGVFGPLTRAAVIAFQRRAGLAADGIVGPITTAALQRTTGWPSTPPRSTPPPSTPPPSTPPPSTGSPGGTSPTVGTFDGKPVASWLIPYLEWARQHGWPGTIYSGYRTPEASEAICLDQCKKPVCVAPDRPCAGRGSNHSGDVKPRGAIDVTDHVEFGELMAVCPYSPRIKNAMPTSDPNHFSESGK